MDLAFKGIILKIPPVNHMYRFIVNPDNQNVAGNFREVTGSLLHRRCQEMLRFNRAENFPSGIFAVTPDKLLM